MPAPSQTLAVANSPTTAPSDEAMPAMGNMQHGMMNDMPGMNHDMHGMQNSMPMSQPAQGHATTQAAVKFTCSMHPEVVSDTPGTCPKCGMKLVMKKGAQ